MNLFQALSPQINIPIMTTKIIPLQSNNAKRVNTWREDIQIVITDLELLQCYRIVL